MRSLRQWSGATLMELWLPIILLAIWWIASAGSTSLYFPPLSAIVESFVENWLDPSEAIGNLVPSLQILFFGYAIAVVGGVTVGTILGLVRPLERAVRPFLETLRAVPGVALLPLFIVLFGIDQPMKVLLVAFGASWPVLLNTVDGVRSVEPVLLDVARTYRVGRSWRLFRIVLPSAGPQIFAGARIALAISLIIMVVAETVGGNGGIGYFLLRAQRDFAITSMWSAIVALGILGYLLNILFRIAERYVLRWHRLQQSRLETNR